jgi:hypothetical protein
MPAGSLTRRWRIRAAPFSFLAVRVSESGGLPLRVAGMASDVPCEAKKPPWRSDVICSRADLKGRSKGRKWSQAMLNRTSYIYLSEPQAQFDLRALRDLFGSSGISLEHPQSGQVVVLSEEGDHLARGRDWLKEALGAVPSISFLWWRNQDEDLYCRIRFVSSFSVLEFGLEGMDGDEEESVVRLLTGAFLMYVNRGVALGFVCDRSGITEDFDWDGFFFKGDKISCELPDIIGIRSVSVGQLGLMPPDIKKRAVNGFLLLEPE